MNFNSLYLLYSLGQHSQCHLIFIFSKQVNALILLLTLGVACMGEMTNIYTILVGKLEGKRLLIRSRLRWEDNI